MDILFLQQYTKTLQEAIRRLSEMEKAGDAEGARKIISYITSLSKNIDAYIKNAE